MRTMGIALALALQLSTAAALAAERKLADYHELLSTYHVDGLYKLPANERDKVQIRWNIKPVNKTIKPSDVVLTLVDGNERMVLPVRPNGDFDLPLDYHAGKGQPVIYTSLPESEKSHISFDALPLLPQGLKFSYPALMQSVPQINALIKKQAGMLRVFMPTFTGVTFKFPSQPPRSIQVVSAAGSKQYAADKNGMVQLKLDEALMKSDTQILLPARPEDVDFLTD